MGIIYPLITFPYVSRILSPEGIGKVEFANSIISFFILLSGLGISSYAVREGAQKRNNQNELNNFMSEMFWLGIIATFFSYILLVILIFSVPKYYEIRILIFICSINVITNCIGFEYLFAAVEDFLYITIRTLLFQIISLICLFIFVKTKNDFIIYAGIGVISTSGSKVLNFFQTKKYIKLTKVNFKNMIKHLKPIMLFFGVAAATCIYQILDTNMIGLLTDSYNVGIYNAAIKTIRIVIPFLTVIASTLVPRLSYYAYNDLEKYNTTFLKVFNLVLMISLPSALGLFVLSEPIIMILCGQQYVDSILLMKLLSPLVFFILIGNMLSDNIFTPLKKDKYLLIPVIIGAIINVIMNSIFIPQFQALGAVIATLIAEILVCIIKVCLSLKIVKIKKLLNETWKYILASGIMFIVIFFVIQLFNNNFYKILISITTGILIYFLVLLLCRSKYFLYFINVFLKKIKKNQIKD